MSYKDNPNKATVEIYKDLMQIEVRALVQRVSELTTTVSALFEEVSSVAVSLEETIVKVEAFGTDISSCRTELASVKKILNEQEEMAGTLLGRICQIETHLEELEKTTCRCKGECSHTESDT